MKILKYTTLSSWLLYCMGFNLCLLHEGKNIEIRSVCGQGGVENIRVLTSCRMR